MFKLVLKQAEEPEIKLPISAGPWKKQEFQKNIYFHFIDYAKAFDYVNHNKLWKILREMGIPDHLICLLRNLYTGQEATVRTGHGTTDWFQIGKGVRQGCILSPCLYFNLHTEYIMRNAGLEEAQARIKIAVRNINNLRYWLKAQHSENKDHGIWSHHFMGNRWGNSGKCQTLFWGAPKSLQMVTAAMKLKDAYSLEEKL